MKKIFLILLFFDILITLKAQDGVVDQEISNISGIYNLDVATSNYKFVFLEDNNFYFISNTSLKKTFVYGKYTIEGEKVNFPVMDIDKIKKDALFSVKKGLMGRSRQFNVDVIVYIDPYEYYTYPYQKKYDIAHCIGKVNQYYKNKNKKLLLIVPGRIGTSSPELGVPVVFSNISEFHVICEVAYSKTGYQPELSFGSHMFQDLVEADMIYCAIMENQNTIAFHPEKLKNIENQLTAILPEEGNIKDIIGVYEVDSMNLRFYYDMEQSYCICI